MKTKKVVYAVVSVLLLIIIAAVTYSRKRPIARTL